MGNKRECLFIFFIIKILCKQMSDDNSKSVILPDEESQRIMALKKSNIYSSMPELNHNDMKINTLIQTVKTDANDLETQRMELTNRGSQEKHDDLFGQNPDREQGDYEAVQSYAVKRAPTFWKMGFLKNNQDYQKENVPLKPEDEAEAEDEENEEGQEGEEFDDPMIWNPEFEWPKKEIKKFVIQSKDWFVYQTIDVPEQIKRRQLSVKIELIWKIQKHGTNKSAFRVVHEPDDGSPENIFDDLPCPPRQFGDVLEIELPKKFVNKIKGLDKLRLEFVVGKTIRMRRLNTITGEPTSDSAAETIMKSDGDVSTTSQRISSVLGHEDCSHKIHLTLLKVSVNCPCLWPLSSQDDTEKFSIRDFVRKRESKGEGQWWELRNVLIKNRILAIKEISLSLDWELRGHPHADDRLVIILVRDGQEQLDTQTVLFGEGVDCDDDKELRLTIPAQRQDTRKEKITVEIPENHDILEEWKEGDNFRFKAFISPGNRLIVHEFRYQFDTIRKSKMEVPAIEFEIPEISGDESKLLITHLIKAYRHSEDKDAKIKVNQALTSDDIENYYKIKLNDGMNFEKDHRDDNFSGPCICGPINVAYINDNPGKLTRTNNFSVTSQGLKPSTKQTTLKDARYCSYLSYTFVKDTPTFILGYMDGSVVIRDANDFQIIFKGKPEQGGCVKRVQTYFDVAQDCFHLSTLLVKEEDSQEMYSLAQYLLTLPKKGEKRIEQIAHQTDYLYSSGIDLQQRREMGLFNLLMSIGTVATAMQKLVFNYIDSSEEEENTKFSLAMVDHVETCAERKIMKPFILQTDQEAGNVFLLQAKDMDSEADEQVFLSTLLIVYKHTIERWEEEKTLNSNKMRPVERLSKISQTPIATESIITDSIMTSDEQTIIVSTLGQGLIIFQVNNLDADPEILQIGSFLKLVMSDCGRFAIAGGVNTVVVIDPLNLNTLGKIPFIDNPCKDIMIQNSEIVYLKLKGGWTIVNVLENNYITSMKGQPLFLNMEYEGYDHIICTREDFKPRAVFGIRTRGDELVAESLLSSHIYVMLTEDEVNAGWEAKDFSLHTGTLTWLIFNKTMVMDENDFNSKVQRIDFVNKKKRKKIQKIPIRLESSSFNTSLSLVNEFQSAILLDTDLKKVINFTTEEENDEPYDMNLAANIYLAQEEYKPVQEKKNQQNEIFRLSKNKKHVVIQKSATGVQVATVPKDHKIKKFTKRRMVRDEVKFEEICFMGGFFAAQRADGKSLTGKNEYGVYKQKTGELLCLFDPSELILVRPSTVDEGRCPIITGIVDKKTLQIYPVCVKSLIHLGAYRMHLTSNELSHDEDLKHSTKIEVLGLPTPIFFGQNLLFVDDDPDSARSKEFVTRPIFNSVVWACHVTKLPNPAKDDLLGVFLVEAENMLHYFTQHDLSSILKKWMIHAQSNYLETGKPPLSMIQGQCASNYIEFFKYCQWKQRWSIFSEISFIEMERIFSLDESVVEIFDLFAMENEWPLKSLKRANVKAQSISQVEHLDDLQSKEVQNDLKKSFFQNKKEAGNKEPKQFTGYVVMCKFNLIPGTEGSVALLNAIEEQGKGGEIFHSKTIQKLISYKYSQVQYIGYMFLFQYVAFILVISTEIVNYNPTVIACFAIFQLILEIFEFISGYNKPHDLFDYFTNYWNYSDMTRVVCAILYYYFDNQYMDDRQNMNHFYNRAISFSIMTLMAWVGILQYLRFFTYFSGFLTLVIDTIVDMNIPLILFVYLSVMFAQCFYMFDYMTGNLKRDERPPFGWIKALINQFLNGFGEFAEDKENYTNTEWAFFILSLLLMLLLVMNLAIAQMGETLTVWKENRTKSTYYLRLTLTRQMESLLIWRRKRFQCCTCCKNDEENEDEGENTQHLVYVEVDNAEMEEMTLNDVTKVLKREIRKVDDATQDQIKEVNEKLTTLTTDIDKALKSQSEMLQKIMKEQKKNVIATSVTNKFADLGKNEKK